LTFGNRDSGSAFLGGSSASFWSNDKNEPSVRAHVARAAKVISSRRSRIENLMERTHGIFLAMLSQTGIPVKVS